MLRTGILRNAPALFKRSTPATTLSRSRYYSSLRLPPKPNSILTNTKISTAFANLSLQKRFVANSVSNKPASDDLPHAALNAKEEAKTLASDIAKIIAGSNYHKASSHGMDGFSDITLGIASNVPKPILVTGLLGGLPYLGTAASTLYYARQAGQLATGLPARVDYDTAISLLEQAAQVQVTYGAVLLSFLGALHWGMEFAAYGGHQGYKRLALGMAPVLVAWPTLALDPTVALAVQWGAFTGLWYADMRATTAGWTPEWYSQYRFYLSILVGTCIIATLAGESYFNPPVDATIFATKSKYHAHESSRRGLGSESVRDTTMDASSNTPQSLASGGRVEGTLPGLGDLEVVEGDKTYVMLHKKSPERAEPDEESKEKQAETAAKQEEKDQDQKKGKAGDVKMGATKTPGGESKK